MANVPSPSSHVPRFDPLSAAVAPAGLLSNGRYRVLVTPAGTGASSAGGVALTNWTADPVEDPHGLFVWVGDRDGGERWRIATDAPDVPAEAGRASRRPGVFAITRERDGVEAHLEICVAGDVDAELRRVRLVNRSSRPRRMDLTTFAEVVLQDPSAHRAHPAFSRLFLETEHEEGARAILVRRRPRARGERHPWLVHAAPGAAGVEVETDRARFVGRGMPPGGWRALSSRAPLSGTAGPVLDAVVALRVAVDLPPGGTEERTFVLAVADGRDEAIGTAGRFADPGAVERTFEAAERAERERRAAAGIDDAGGESLQALAGAMAYGHPALRRARPVPSAGVSPGRLRAHGIAGDFLTVVCPGVPADRAADLARAHRYWRSLGLPSELVVLRDGDGAGDTRPDAGCHLLDPGRLPAGDVDALVAAARLVVDGASGDPADGRAVPAPTSATSADAPAAVGPAASADGRDETLRFFNGYGGFSPDGTEYVVRLPRRSDGTRRLPPNPWINVIANEEFGCLVSETGAGTTWSGNSRERRLTPWANDPVRDPHSEAFYLRDDESGELWSAMPGPAPGPVDYETRHGFGASAFRTSAHGIASECEVFVPRGERVRLTVVRLRNDGKRRRRLSVAAYARLVLGGHPDDDARFVVTDADPESGTIFARSVSGGAFGGGLVFAAALGGRDGSPRFTTDRLAFLGPRGTPARPAGLARGAALDGRVGWGVDPCAAQCVAVEVPPGATSEVVFLLGEADDRDGARAVVERYRRTGAAVRARDGVRAFWSGVLSAMVIDTPQPELDVLVNGWLPYQVLSCRMWGRSAFYQSGGAFGFRDQIQDASALLWFRPDLTRAQVLLHAAHQFREGDVLHWWHPPDGRGIRTRFADDLVWLPWLAALYVRTTGDDSVLDEDVPFVEGRPLAPGEAEAFLAPARSDGSASLYEHCVRALDRALTRGERGLPLFGAGDWNDGMNRVGAEGKGESVWLGMFLFSVLGDFLPLCEVRGDHAHARRYREYRDDMRRAVNDAGWDGEWYLRGYYDDGKPLGTHVADECRIDALVQAWATLSGIAPADRARRAMDAVEEHLVSREDGLIRLLAPPFDRTGSDPGYIRGYVPGVRENGGQYTHGALWVIRAMAELGRRDRVAALLHLLSPVRHAADRAAADRYRVEPYVVAADVYGVAPHTGRGGWTWYTGAAGWMVRIAVESLFGLRVTHGRTLTLRPCLPDDWPQARLDWRVPGGETRYAIRIANPRGMAGAVSDARLDGTPVPVAEGKVEIPLASDGRIHHLDVELGPVPGRKRGPDRTRPAGRRS